MQTILRCLFHFGGVESPCLALVLSTLACLAEAAPDIDLSRSQAARPAEYLESYFAIAPFGEVFGMLYDNIVYDKDGLYYINSFSLPENARAIEEVVKDATPKRVVSHVPLYVNPAFMRYIRNEDHQ